MIPKKIKPFIEIFLLRYPSVREIWLIGSRCSGKHHPDSDWDLLVFGDADLLATLRLPAVEPLPRDVDVLIVYDGDSFEAPHLESGKSKIKKGSLSGWNWQRTGDSTAQYTAWKAVDSKNYIRRIGSAIRLWPEAKDTQIQS